MMIRMTIKSQNHEWRDKQRIGFRSHGTAGKRFDMVHNNQIMTRAPRRKFRSRGGSMRLSGCQAVPPNGMKIYWVLPQTANRRGRGEE
jgi:hypothetical protein